MTSKQQLKWWQEAVFYQIYPRSFADGNGDGIGDYTGMISKLDYLKDLGIGAIWLSPHFPSPFIDCGYDISDYQNVAPEYGDLAQFKQFLAGAHDRGIKIVLDLVLNHTSDKHPWFIESKSSLTNPKRDWYIWKKGKKGKPPTNWFSAFGGSAWEFDKITGEYYYHYFFVEQPDLNWKNPEVQKAMFDTARFWLDMGVDGFRLDAVGTIFEDERYPNLTLQVNQDQLFKMEQLAKTLEDHQVVFDTWMEMFKNQVDQPEVHQITRELRKVINQYDDRVLIGETDDIAFYGKSNDELHLNFNFPLMRTSRLTADQVRKNQQVRLAALPKKAWPCNTLGNHDSNRVYSNFGDGIHNQAQARLYLMMLLTLKGTPFLYNGEEIGMSDLMITDAARFRDPLGSLYYDMEKRVMGSSEEQAVLVGAIRGRDKSRTPLQWSNSPNGGFCPAGIQPWLPLNPDFQSGVNVEEQETDPKSLLHYYRQMLAIRKLYRALIDGEYEEIDLGNAGVLGFYRKKLDQRLLVLLNMNKKKEKIKLNSPASCLCVLDTNGSPRDISGEVIQLEAYQGIILEVR